MIKPALTLLVIIALANATIVKKVVAKPAQPKSSDYNQDTQYLENAIRNTKTVRETLGFLKKEVSSFATDRVVFSEPMTETAMINYLNALDKKSQINYKSTFGKDLPIELKNIQLESWMQFNMIKKTVGTTSVNFYQVLIKRVQKGNRSLFVAVTNHVTVPNWSSKLKLISTSRSHSDWGHPFHSLKISNVDSNMAQVYGSDKYVDSVRTYCNAVSLAEVLHKIEEINKQNLSRKLQIEMPNQPNQGIATATAISELVDKFAANYKNVADAIKTKITSGPIKMLVKTGFSKLEIISHSSSHCVRSGVWGKFVHMQKGALKSLIDAGFPKEDTDRVMDMLELAEMDNDFEDNDKAILFNEGENSTAKAWEMTYTRISPKAKQNDCIEFYNSITYVPAFKLADNIMFVDHSTNAAGGVVDTQWIAQEKQPRSMSLEEVAIFEGFLKAFNYDNFLDLVGVPKTAVMKATETLQELNLKHLAD